MRKLLKGTGWIEQLAERGVGRGPALPELAEGGVGRIQFSVGRLM